MNGGTDGFMKEQHLSLKHGNLHYFLKDGAPHQSYPHKVSLPCITVKHVPDNPTDACRYLPCVI